jgi:gliding motility-associated-like protein
MNTTFKLFILSVIVFCTSIQKIHAQQIAGGEITYTCKGSNQYEVTFVIYAKCPIPSLSSSYTVSYYSASSNDAPLRAVLTQDGPEVEIKACENATSRCNGGDPTKENTEAIVKRVFKGTIKLPKQAKDWVVEVATSKRTSDLTSAKPDNMYLKATINNTGTICNNSSTFSKPPAFFSAEGSVITLNPGITNIDGDKLQIALVSPMVTPKIGLTYNAPYSATQPFATTSPIFVNGGNGLISFTPSTQGEKSSLAIEVKEFKNGVEVGSVMREMYTQTVAKKEALPYFKGEGYYNLCQGTSDFIVIEGLTDVPGATIDMTVDGAPASEYTITKSNQKVSLRFLTSFNRNLTLTIIDSKCGKAVKNILVRIVPKPVITNPTTDSTILCRKPFNFTVKTIGGTAPYTYLWNTGSKTATAEVFDPGTYSVTVIDTNKCTATWSRKVKSDINFSFGQSRCVDDAISFKDISNNIPGIKSYNWTFGVVSVPNAGASPSHKFPTSGTYDVTMEIVGDAGCSNSITKKINIFPKPKIDFVAVDTCQKTEMSDLKVVHTLTPNLPLDTTTNLSNIKYLVNDKIPTIQAVIPKTELNAFIDGSYKVKLTAVNDAGCISEIVKTIKVRKKPTYEFYPLVAKYFYRCDNPSSIDTVFKFQVKSAPDLVTMPMKLTVQRASYSDSIVQKYVSMDSIIVPYHIVQNAVNDVTIKMQDSLGCTNDTIVIIQDPITPNLVLKKYYCSLNDNLIIVDTAFKLNQYHWGLDSLRWDLNDGSFATTKGFVNHAYTDIALDEAVISLYVRDKTNCVDTTSKSKMKVFLSEPDTNQFALSKFEACNTGKDTVFVTGIKNKYINSWYYRLNDRPNLIFSNPSDPKLITNKAFGKSIPDVDTFKVNGSNKYIATAGIIYNDSTIGQGCKAKRSRDWQVLEKLTFSIDPAYNHCKDSVKFFKAKFTGAPVAALKLDTASWNWKLKSPTNVILDQNSNLINNELAYNPDTSLFKEVATTQPLFIAQYPAYKLQAFYSYLSDNNTRCFDSTSVLSVGNELVQAEVKDSDPTCAFYSNQFYSVKNELFNFSSDTIIWTYGNGKSDTLSGVPGNALYPIPGKFPVKAVFINQFGCRHTDTSSVIVKPSPKAKLVVDSVCAGVPNRLDGSFTVPQQETNKYYWYLDFDVMPKSSDNSNIPDTILATLVNSDSVLYRLLERTTSVMLAVQNSVGCFSYTDSAKVAKVNPVPIVDYDAIAVNTQDKDYLGNQPIAFDEQTANIDSGTKVTWTWDMGDGIKLVSDTSNKSYDITYTYPYYAPPYPATKNTYTVTLNAKTKEGCSASKSKTLDLNAYFVLPSAFSPNEDGLHDFLIGVGKGIKELKEFKLFNRWGEEVQSIKGIPTKDAENRGYLLWDGKYKGDAQPVGSYVYYAVVLTGNGDELIFKGNLALVK